MKLRLLVIMLTACLFAVTSCDENQYGPAGHVPDQEQEDDGKSETSPEDEENPAIYVKGADISWVTQMEKDGVKVYDADGQETDCFKLMKELGFNAIRLRVWVNPEDGWCGKEDVIAKASRAYNLGMKVMIDFHYSDTWADPANQTPPAQWKDFTADEMNAAVSAHTKDVLEGLKKVGVEVNWVQIGNEVNSGMLHPLGKVQGKDAAVFASFVNSGYKTVKDIYPDAKVILHVSNGHDAGLFDWFFSLMKTCNASYDIIGMSLYPVWWENGGWSSWNGPVSSCISNIRSLIAGFGKPVMICETGLPVSEPQMAKEALHKLISETAAIEGCLGTFYWEPQTDGVWKPESYNALGWNAYDKGAFKNGQATTALAPFHE